MKMILTSFALVFTFLIAPIAAFAQVPSPTPDLAAPVVAAVDQAHAAVALDWSTALADVLLAVRSMGGISGAGKILCGILLFIALCKVSADGKIPLLASVWPKSEDLKKWVAPFLGLAIGLVEMSMNGTGITLAGALTFMAVGHGSSYLHNLLDLIKLIPGLGPIYVTVINVIQSALGPSDSAAK